MGADLRVELGEQLAGLLAGAGDEVEHVEAGEDAVAFGDVAAEAVAATFFAADQRIGLHHLRAEELEADLRLVHGHVVDLAEALHHGGRRDRLDDCAAFATNLEQIVREQREHLELVDEVAVLVGDAYAIGVTVRGDADIEAALRHQRFHLAEVARDRLRCVHAGEYRVAEAVQFGDVRFAAIEQRAEVAGAGAVHRVVGDVQSGGLQTIDIDEARELR